MVVSARQLAGSAFLSASLLAFAIFVSGCAAGGARFTPIDPVPAGKALVYFYRVNSFYGGGVRYPVGDGDQEVVVLVSGGYFPYLTGPGQHTFWAYREARMEVTRDLHPGRVYYLRGQFAEGGVLVERVSLEFVDPSVAREEIERARLLPPAE